MSVPLPVVTGRPAVQSGQHSGERDAVYFRRTTEAAMGVGWRAASVTVPRERNRHFCRSSSLPRQSNSR